MTSGGGAGGSSGAADVLFIDLKGRMDGFEQQLKLLESQVDQTGQRAGNSLGKSLSAGLAIATTGALALAGALTAVGASSFNLAQEAAQNVNDLQSKLGLTKAEAEDVGKVAERVFGNNFGESLTEAGEGVAAVRQQLGALSDNELQKVTEGAFAIKDVFGTEVPETVSATKTLMQEFGLTSQEALDFLAKGFQSGLDRSGDFLDTINEYGTQFKSGGASADEFFSIIKSGSQGGALGTDKAADSFAEFRKIITAGGDSVSKALTDIGLDADGIQERIANGSLKVVDAYGLVNKALAKTKDNTVQAGAGTTLLGTQFEDLGTKGTFNINSTNTKLKDMAGATDSLNVKYNNLGSFFTGAMRQLQVALLPVGKELLSLANEATPYLTKAFAVIGDKLPGYIKIGIDAAKSFGSTAVNVYSTVRPVIDTTITTVKSLGVWLEKNKEILIPLAAAVAAGATAFGVYRLAVAAVTLGTALWTAAQTAATVASVALRAALTFLTGPVGLVIAAIALLVGAGVALYRNWDEVKAFAEKTWGKIVSIISDAINGAKAYLENIDLSEIGRNIVQGLANGIKAGVGAIGDAARNLGSSLVKGIEGILDMHSPSRVMHQLGVFTGEGFVNGLNSKHPDVVKAAQETGKAFTSALKDLQLEKLAGSISQTEYIKTLTDVAAQLRAQIGTVKEGTPAYSEWLDALTKVNKELAVTTGKSQAAQQAAKEHAAEIAKNVAQISQGEAMEKYVQGLRSAKQATLESALATAKNSGEVEKYNAIKAELSRREEVGTTATKKASDAVAEHTRQVKDNVAQISQGEAMEKYVQGLRSALVATLETALATAKSSGEIEKYNAIKAELSRREEVSAAATKKASDAVAEHTRQVKDNIAQINQGEAMERYVQSLRIALPAQLDNALAIAKSHGETEKYNVIKAEQQRREDAATAATQKATDAAKQQADQLVQNRKAIADGLEYDRWRVAMERATDAQLASGLAAYEAAGNQQRYSDVAAEIKRRAGEAADEVDRLTDAQRTQAFARYTDTQGVTDSSYRQTYGAGDEGLIKSLAATTGLSVDAIRADVQGALEDAKRFSSEAASVIERVYADALAHRKQVATEQVAEAQRVRDAEVLAAQQVRDTAIQLSEDLNRIRKDRLAEEQKLEASLNQYGGTSINVNTGETVYQTDDQLKGIGVAVEGVTEDFFNLQAAIDGIGSLSKTELDMLISGAKLSKETADALREAWEKAFASITKGPLLPDSLQGRGIQREAGVTDAATGLLSDADKKSLTKVLDDLVSSDKPAEIGQRLADLVAAGFGDSDLAELLRGYLLKVENDVQDSLNQYGGITIDVNTSDSIYQTDEQLRGIGVTAGDTADAFIDLESVIKNTATLSIEELQGVLDAAGLTEEQAQKVRDAWREHNVAVLATVQGYDELGNAIYASDDELRGIGVAADSVGENFLDLAEVTRNTLGVTFDELNRLIVVMGLTREQAEVLRGAWVDNQNAILDATKKDQEEIRQQNAKTITEWGNYAKQVLPMVGSLFASLSGESSEVAAQWGQDLGSMTNDLVNFGLAIAKGDYVGAAVQAFTTIFNWFTRNKKAAEDAAKATKSYNEAFRFSADGYGTRQVSTYKTGYFFWETTHYKESINEAGKALALAIEGGILNGIDDGFTKALASGSFDDFGKSLETSVGQAVLKGLQAEYIAQYMNAVLGPKIGAIIKARSTPGTEDDVAAIADLKNALPGIKADAQSFFDEILVPVAKEFGLYGTDVQEAKPASVPKEDAPPPRSNLSPIASSATQAAPLASLASATVTQTVDLTPITVLSTALGTYIPMLAESGRDHLAAAQMQLDAARQRTNWANNNRQ